MRSPLTCAEAPLVKLSRFSRVISVGKCDWSARHQFKLRVETYPQVHPSHSVLASIERNMSSAESASHSTSIRYFVFIKA